VAVAVLSEFDGCKVCLLFQIFVLKKEKKIEWQWFLAAVWVTEWQWLGGSGRNRKRRSGRFKRCLKQPISVHIKHTHSKTTTHHNKYKN
jgi:hypothetical protein